jgi:tetratricopeptide (TPR) repeat protein
MLVQLFLCAALAAQMGAPPELPPALRGLSSLLEEPEKFTDTLREIDKRDKKRVQTLLDRTQMLDPAGQQAEIDALIAEAGAIMDTVRAAYEVGLYHHAENARLRNYYGELLLDGYSDEQQAALAWREALTADPKLAAAHANLGMYLCAKGNTDMGLPHLDEAIDLEPGNATFYYNLSRVYLLRRDDAAATRGWDQVNLYKRAMEASKKAVEMAPHDFEFLQDYAVNFFAARDLDIQPDWDEAAKAWQRARAHAPSLASVFFAWLNEARAYVWAGDRARAEQSLLQALRIRPDHPDATAMLEGLRAGVEF